MRRTALLLTALALLPLAPAGAAPARPVVRAWVAEKVSPDATPVTVHGGAGVADHDYALAAVASATAGRDGRFTDADGALFFGATVDSTPRVFTPGGTAGCDTLPNAGTACAELTAGGAIGFVVWWDDPAGFDRVVVAVRGLDPEAGLGDDVRGWRLRRWTGRVTVAGGDVARATTPAGTGAGTFLSAEAPGGQAGSVAIGHRRARRRRTARPAPARSGCSAALRRRPPPARRRRTRRRPPRAARRSGRSAASRQAWPTCPRGW